MKRIRLLATAGVAAAVLASAGAAQGPTVTGSVGPGFSISLTDSSGAAVSSLQPGDYTFQIHDLSSVHSFHLVGPGVDQDTAIETLSDPIWNVTLAQGTYRFYCDAHPTQLTGTFTVGTQSPPPPPPPPPPPVRALKLLAKVGPGSSITMTTTVGARVRRTVAGVYSITVRDLSVRDDFHLTGPGVNRRTSVSRETTTVWKVTLSSGTYRYRSDSHPKLKGSFVVASPA